MPFLSQKPLHAAAKQAHARRRPVERMPPSIKEEHRVAKKAQQRRPVERMPPSIKEEYYAAKKAQQRRRPVERMPPSIKEEHRAAKRAQQRRPVGNMPPSIKVQYHAAKASKRLRINRKPTNREVFNLLMNNPYLNRVERDSMIKTHCGVLMPVQLTF